MKYKGSQYDKIECLYKMSANEFAVSPTKEIFLRIVLEYSEVIEKCEEHECKDFLLTKISKFLLVNKKYIEGSLQGALVEKYRELSSVNEKYQKYYRKLFGDVKESVYSFTSIRTCVQTELEAVNESSTDVSQTENSTEVKSFHECKILENGAKKYYNEKGELHRTDGPAIEWPSGNKWWYQHGKRHRTDGPAIERTNGTKEWYLNGKRHRTDGPAVVRVDGYQAWYLNGNRHRTDGPAVVRVDGYQAWYLNGEFHRIGGPAIEWADGDKSWYHNGELHRTDGPSKDWPYEGVVL